MNKAPADFKEKKPLYKPYKSTKAGKKEWYMLKKKQGKQKKPV